MDLRYPIGLLLSIYGAILAADGLVEHTEVLGLNVNLWWGVVMLASGLVALAFAYRTSTRAR